MEKEIRSGGGRFRQDKMKSLSGFTGFGFELVNLASACATASIGSNAADKVLNPISTYTP